jgi:thiamine pyrophosphate-dependent acetolactate synthase large subunit-like protein
VPLLAGRRQLISLLFDQGLASELPHGGIEFGPIDYIKYAQAFGATGLMINTAYDVAPVMKKAFDAPGPVIVGCMWTTAITISCSR